MGWDTTGTFFGHPQKYAPGFQKEWAYLECSAVSAAGIAADATITLCLAPSSIDPNGDTTSGTIAIWGYGVANTNQGANIIGHFEDEAAVKYFSANAHGFNGSFQMFANPVLVTPNHKVLFRFLATTVNNSFMGSHITLFYTTLRGKV